MINTFRKIREIKRLENQWYVNRKERVDYFQQSENMLENQKFFKVFELPTEEEVQRKWNEIEGNISVSKELNKVKRINDYSFHKNNDTFCLTIVFEAYVLKKQYALPEYHRVIAGLELSEEKEKEIDKKTEAIKKQYVLVNKHFETMSFIRVNPLVIPLIAAGVFGPILAAAVIYFK